MADTCDYMQTDTRKELERVRAELDEAKGYLGRLFLHYAPQCELQPTLIGICTQIDNCMMQIKDLTELREAASVVLTFARRDLRLGKLQATRDLEAVLAKVRP